MYFLIKVILSALIIAGASELAKAHRLLAAILLSLPLTSLLAIVWIYIDNQDRSEISHLTQDIFWFVLISLIFFIAFPLLLRTELNFWLAMLSACLLTSAGYCLFLMIKSWI